MHIDTQDRKELEQFRV